MSASVGDCGVMGVPAAFAATVTAPRLWTWTVSPTLPISLPQSRFTTEARTRLPAILPRPLFAQALGIAFAAVVVVMSAMMTHVFPAAQAAMLLGYRCDFR